VSNIEKAIKALKEAAKKHNKWKPPITKNTTGVRLRRAIALSKKIQSDWWAD